MRIMVLGADGYLGWPTCMYLSKKGHDVFAIDNYVKRNYERDVCVSPLQRTYKLNKRCDIWKDATGLIIQPAIFDVSSFILLCDYLMEFKPDTIIHYAEQPSAPYSMATYIKCKETILNNISSTLSILWAIKNTDTHLIKLGTMGEYGTPNIDIEEGYINLEVNGRCEKALFPKKPGSFYHASKVADSTMIDFACRAWGTVATDLHQGVVYGINTDETILADGLHTSFHYDSVFGTVLNRFITQAATTKELTVYGSGGQTRGYLNIVDTLRCVELACENPPTSGGLEVFNQFTEQFSVYDLALKVSRLTRSNIKSTINPRIEEENHYYNAKHTKLEALGLKPTPLINDVIINMYEYVLKNVRNVDTTKFNPEINWR